MNETRKIWWNKHREEQREKNRLWKKSHKVEIKEWNKKYCSDNKTRIAKYHKKHYRANREAILKVCCIYRNGKRDKWKQLDYCYKRNYGISLNDYQAIYTEQHGRCLGCGSEKSAHGRNGLHVDHCHVTGKIRGLLCNMCNQALGRAKDNPVVLRTLASYLERNYYYEERERA